MVKLKFSLLMPFDCNSIEGQIENKTHLFDADKKIEN